ncbi:MAG: methyltransferase [Dehalococcoidia bacterium]|nr:methyltransferase [Dehalococcoidia bacterium]
MATRLGPIRVRHPEGTFAPSEASRIALEAIGTHQELLHGNGIDWGSGSGCLAIATARVPAVREVTGLELSEVGVTAARANAVVNDVSENTRFMAADSFAPASDDDATALNSLLGNTDFLIANPPSSEGDGFDYYRRVLREAGEFLVDGAPVFITTSIQYGTKRVEGLAEECPGFSYDGILASTDWVPFDLDRPDLMHCLELYAREEERGGPKYEFGGIEGGVTGMTDARTALAEFQRSRRRPLTKWLTYLFVRRL